MSVSQEFDNTVMAIYQYLRQVSLFSSPTHAFGNLARDFVTFN